MSMTHYPVETDKHKKLVNRSRPTLLHIETQAFGLLYNRYYPVVKKYIHAVSNSCTECAEDMAQDIFFKLWQRRDHIMEIASWEDYLFCMVKNNLINRKRKAGARRKAVKHLIGTASRLYYGTEEDINYRETCRLLCVEIQLLPPKARMAYTLREQEGFKNHEIAQVMGISKSVAKQHLQAAAKKIKSQLKYSLLLKDR
jgi:RNA polymerase sigma-70 factor, ECF subfamily